MLEYTVRRGAIISSVGLQVRMGFAHRNPDNMEGLAYIGSECKLGTGGYTCPRQDHPSMTCAGRLCSYSPAVSIPCTCPLHIKRMPCCMGLRPMGLWTSEKRKSCGVQVQSACGGPALQLPCVRPDTDLFAAPGALLPPPVPCQGLCRGLPSPADHPTGNPHLMSAKMRWLILPVCTLFKVLCQPGKGGRKLAPLGWHTR